MRRPLLLLSLLVVTSSLLAADSDRWRVSILASEISTSSNQPPNDPHAGIAVGVAYEPTPQWDVELTAASQSHISPFMISFYMPNPNGGPGQIFTSFEYHRYRVTPVDVSLTRHFLADQAIAPYLRAGVRYVAAPHDGLRNTVTVVGPVEQELLPVSGTYGFENRASLQAGGGVRVRLTERTGVRLEATRLLRSQGVDFDPLTRFAAGVTWKF